MPPPPASDPLPTPERLLRLRELRQQLLADGTLAAVDQALTALLPAQPAIATAGGKIVKDPVWGIIKLPGYLLPLIDSRLLQRQRRIRQLGMSYLVYPGSGYSRFEHALGACHVMSQLLDAIRSNAAPGDGLVTLDEGRAKQMMLGALLHDVGHMPFSHASEAFMEQHADQLKIGPQSVDAVILAVNEAFNRTLRLAEVLSILVVLAPRFHAFLTRPAPPDPEPQCDFFLHIAAFIAGSHVGNADVAYSMLLSGPLDCDRLDYMLRDAHVSGVPVSVDIARLLARCRFIRKAPSQLPPGWHSRLASENADATLFVTDLSGANALEELAISRFILYDRIYYHQKTQAAQAVLAQLLECALEAKSISTDVLSFWAESDESLLHSLQSVFPAKRLAERLLYRELPKRALVFGQRLIQRPAIASDMRGSLGNSLDALPPNEHDSFHASRVDSGIANLLDDIDDIVNSPDDRRRIEQAIVAKAREIAKLLTGTGYDPVDPLTTVAITSRPASPFSKLGESLVVDLDGEVAEFKKYMPLGQWSGAYDLNKKLGYVFTDPGWEAVVNIAAEWVIWHEAVVRQDQVTYRFRLLRASSSHAKVSFARIDRMKQLLDAKGFFASCWPLRPLAIAPPQVAECVALFGSFQGADSWGISAESVGNFLRQFPSALQEDARRLLNAIVYLSRKHLVAAFRRSLGQIRAATPHGSVAIAGLTPNSGEILRVLIEADLKKEYSDCDFVRAGAAAAAAADIPLILIDDVLGTGSQAVTQLHALLWVPRDAWADPTEKNIHDQPLDDECRDAFKRRPIRVAYAMGTDTGKQRLEDVAATLDIADFKVVLDGGVKFDDPSTIMSPPLASYLQEAGASVLKSSRPRTNASDAERDALGYERRTSLIVSMFNVPTGCPAALWCPGEFRGVPWVPLFIRRGYQDEVVYI